MRTTILWVASVACYVLALVLTGLGLSERHKNLSTFGLSFLVFGIVFTILVNYP